MMIAARIAVGVLGVVIVVLVVDAAIRTFVLPRGATVTVTRIIARTLRQVFDLVARPAKSYEQRDRVMALYAPLTLLAFPTVWLAGIFVGFIGIFWAAEHVAWSEAVRLSGSALFTL